MRKKREKPRIMAGSQRQPFIFRTICSIDPAFEEGEGWEEFFLKVREMLFDYVGEIEDVKGGFFCVPERLTEVPLMFFDCPEKTVDFQVVGFYGKKEAVMIIQSGMKNFASKFSSDVAPVKFECWLYRGANKTPILVEKFDFFFEKNEISSESLRYWSAKSGQA